MKKEGGKELFDIEKSFKQYFYPLLLITLIFLVVCLLNRDSLVTYWPYIILLMGLLITTKLMEYDKKLGVIFFFFFFVGMFGLQFWYYFALPHLGNYQIINFPTFPPRMAIFQMDGKFKISYYPDYLKPNDQVTMYVDVCSPGETICEKCDNCTLSAYFINEEGAEKFLFKNQTLLDREKIEFIFPGRQIKVLMEYPSLDSYEFNIPKLSFWQIVKNILSHPSIYLVSFIASLVGLIGVVGTIIGTVRKSKTDIKTRIYNGITIIRKNKMNVIITSIIELFAIFLSSSLDTLILGFIVALFGVIYASLTLGKVEEDVKLTKKDIKKAKEELNKIKNETKSYLEEVEKIKRDIEDMKKDIFDTFSHDSFTNIERRIENLEEEIGIGHGGWSKHGELHKLKQTVDNLKDDIREIKRKLGIY